MYIKDTIEKLSSSLEDKLAKSNNSLDDTLITGNFKGITKDETPYNCQGITQEAVVFNEKH